MAAGLLRHLPRRVVLAAAGLVYWVTEGIGVAVDQWLGHSADPSSDWASPAGVWLFLGLAVASAIALARLLPLLHAAPESEAWPALTGGAPAVPQGWVIDSTSSASSS